jgi:hypothetical protein
VTTWTSSLVEPLRASTGRIESSLAAASLRTDNLDAQLVAQDKRLTVLEDIAKRGREDRMAAQAQAMIQFGQIQATQQKQGESLAAIAATLEILRSK